MNKECYHSIDISLILIDFDIRTYSLHTWGLFIYSYFLPSIKQLLIAINLYHRFRLVWALTKIYKKICDRKLLCPPGTWEFLFLDKQMTQTDHIYINWKWHLLFIAKKSSFVVSAMIIFSWLNWNWRTQKQVYTRGWLDYILCIFFWSFLTIFFGAFN